MVFVFWVDLVTRLLMWGTLLFAIGEAARPSQKLLARRRRDFTDRTGAYLDPHFTVAFDRETRRTLRWLGVLALALGAFFEVALDLDLEVRSPNATFAPYSVLAAVWLAAFATTRLRSAGRVFTVPGSPTAVARPRRVVIGDYVGWPLQMATWLLVAADVALAAVSTGAWRRGEVPAAELAIGLSGMGITVVMSAATLWFARALCERPTPAVDPSHLYLQDAWRARSLSSAYGAVCLSGYVAFLGLVFVPDVRWLDSAMGVAMYPVMGAILAIGLSQATWFRRRLWRGLPPGQVLYPGQQLPPESIA